MGAAPRAVLTSALVAARASPGEGRITLVSEEAMLPIRSASDGAASSTRRTRATSGEVGRILAGADGGYDRVSSFFTEVFGTTIKLFGDVSRFDEVATEGSLDEAFLAT